MADSDVITATPGRIFTVAVTWPHDNTPVWTKETGWHPDLHRGVSDLLFTARAGAKDGALLVAPQIPDHWYQACEQAASADGVRAMVAYDILQDSIVCYLSTVEAIPDGGL